MILFSVCKFADTTSMLLGMERINTAEVSLGSASDSEDILALGCTCQK